MARLVHQSSLEFPGHNDLSIPSSQPRTPTVEDKQLALEDAPSLPATNDHRRSSYEFKQIPLPSSNEQSSDLEKRGPTPAEYRLSRTEGGALPKRVLHSRSATAYSEDGEGEKAKVFDKDVEKEAASDTSSIQSRSPAGEKQKDPNIVDWDGPDDPTNPMNWKASKKTATIVLASLITFITCVSNASMTLKHCRVLQGSHAHQAHAMC